MSDYNRSIVWVHGDCLSPYNPALLAQSGSPAIWVWDDELLRQWRISLKRIIFIYECLLELPVIIRRGQVVAEISDFARKNRATTVATTESPGPRFKTICQALGQADFEVEVYRVEPFLNYSDHLDLKRFSRYWRVAQKHVFD